METTSLKKIAVIIAHPDDETLWAGGSLLTQSFDSCFILSLCRANDMDRNFRFGQALKEFKATGTMADLDDGPDQVPLNAELIYKTILENLPSIQYDRLYTHSPRGEYTSHLRHEETGQAVLQLWIAGRIQTDEICLFAYEDGKHTYLPRPIKQAPITLHLSDEIWLRKYKIIREIYNFEQNSFEARTTPHSEAFWLITKQNEALQWLENKR